MAWEKDYPWVRGSNKLCLCRVSTASNRPPSIKVSLARIRWTVFVSYSFIIKLITECIITFSTFTATVNEMEGRERLDLPKVFAFIHVKPSVYQNNNRRAQSILVRHGSLKFASSAFLRRSCTGWRQRPLARWFHPHIWLVHLNLSGRWQHDPPKEGRVLWQVTIVRLTQTRDFCFYDERHI